MQNGRVEFEEIESICGPIYEITMKVKRAVKEMEVGKLSGSLENKTSAFQELGARK